MWLTTMALVVVGSKQCNKSRILKNTATGEIPVLSAEILVLSVNANDVLLTGNDETKIKELRKLLARESKIKEYKTIYF